MKNLTMGIEPPKHFDEKSLEDSKTGSILERSSDCGSEAGTNRSRGPDEDPHNRKTVPVGTSLQ